MIIYNETFIIEDAAAPNWLEWVKENHIADVMATGIFDGFRILTVLDSPNEGVTYCIQYETESVEKYSDFHYKHLDDLHAKHNAVWENQFVLFNSVMESVD